MALDKVEKDRRKAVRTCAVLWAENRHRPIRYWGTLHVSSDFDIGRARRGLTLAHRRGTIPPTFVKIEQSKRGVRPHFHFAWHDDPVHADLRRSLVEVFGRQGVPGHRLRLSVSPIQSSVAVFRYLAKASQNHATVKRTTFTVGPFFHRPTKDLLKKTAKQIWESKVRHVMHDPVALHCIMAGIVSREELRDNRWLSYWKHVGWWRHRHLVPDDRHRLGGT